MSNRPFDDEGNEISKICPFSSCTKVFRTQTGLRIHFGRFHSKTHETETTSDEENKDSTTGILSLEDHWKMKKIISRLLKAIKFKYSA